METTAVEMVTCNGYSVKASIVEEIKARLAETKDPRSLSAGDFYVAYKFGLLEGMLPGWKRESAEKSPLGTLLDLAEDRHEVAQTSVRAHSKKGNRADREERDAKIAAFYKEGKKPSAIAKELGLSQARVRGILIQANLLVVKKKGE